MMCNTLGHISQGPTCFYLSLIFLSSRFICISSMALCVSEFLEAFITQGPKCCQVFYDVEESHQKNKLLDIKCQEFTYIKSLNVGAYLWLFSVTFQNI